MTYNRLVSVLAVLLPHFCDISRGQTLMWLLGGSNEGNGVAYSAYRMPVAFIGIIAIPFATRLVRRAGARRSASLAALGLGIVSVAFAGVAASGSVSLASLLLPGAVLGCLISAFNPAMEGLQKDLAGPGMHDQHTQLRWSELLRWFAFAFGAAVGLVSGDRCELMFISNAVAYLVVAAAIWLLAAERPAGKPETREQSMNPLRALLPLLKSTEIRLMVALAFFAELLVIVGWNTIPAMMKRELGAGRTEYLWINVAGGVGALLGALFAYAVSKRAVFQAPLFAVLVCLPGVFMLLASTSSSWKMIALCFGGCFFAHAYFCFVQRRYFRSLAGTVDAAAILLAGLSVAFILQPFVLATASAMGYSAAQTLSFTTALGACLALVSVIVGYRPLRRAVDG